mgnify:CR=1 FL=1
MAGPYRKEFADTRLGVYVSFDLVMICGELFDLASGKQLDIADSIAVVRKAVCLLCASHLWYLLSNQICAGYVFVPGRKPDTAGLTGIHDPVGVIFLLSRPRWEKPETARTAGRSERAGAFTTPALSACFFFVLRPLVEKPPKRGLTFPIGVGGLPPPIGGHTGPHSGPHGAVIRCPAFTPSAFPSNPRFHAPEGGPASDLPCRQST